MRLQAVFIFVNVFQVCVRVYLRIFHIIQDEKRAFWDDYYVKMDVDNIENLKIQKEEVESLHWFSESEIKELMSEGEFFENHYEEFENLLEWLKNK